MRNCGIHDKIDPPEIDYIISLAAELSDNRKRVIVKSNTHPYTTIYNRQIQ